MDRANSFRSLQQPFDVLIVGGGATGLGLAVDAATRGFRTALIEGGDFAQATSSRATKLAHGGVRYLASGQIHLVYEALHERAVMVQNAPHLVHPQPFLLPTYTHWERPYYGAGLLLYDLMSGRATMGPTRILSAKATLERMPNLQPEKLTGSILYHDGQFNDARLALALARTAADHGATVLNYTRCTCLLHSNGKVAGAVVTDAETGAEYTINATTVFNATGIFTDDLRKLDDPATPPLLSVSRGTHIVVPASVLGGGAGIMVPKTADGRVIFAIPWQGRVVIGTTDIPAGHSAMEPGHTPDEIAFLIETINPFLAHKIGTEDVLSVFSGLRPLVTGKQAKTSRLSREHHINASSTGMVTIAGGKWTTYRRMAEDTLNFAAARGLLEKRLCLTRTTALHGAPLQGSPVAGIADLHLREYGTDAAQIAQWASVEAGLAERIDPALPYTFAQALYGVRFEMARTLEDVMSRRTRSLLLDEKAALRAAPRVVALMAAELRRDETWQREQLAGFAALIQSDYSIDQDRLS